MTLKNALKQFILCKKLAGVKDNSLRNYSVTISYMLNYVGADAEISALTHTDVNNYILYLLSKPISRATQSSYIRNDKIFLMWLYTEYDLSFDPLKIKVPKSPKKNVHIYNDSEILELFRAVETSVPWITARNRVIIALMLDSGLRQSEVSTLLHMNIDRKNRIMKITGKGAKDRMVPLGSVTTKLLDCYLLLCPYSDSNYVFYNKYGEQMSCNAIRLFVGRTAKKLNLPLSSHKLRHNFATNYCIDNIKQNGNSNVYDLGIIMGHESIETTKKYEHFAHELLAVKNSISHLDMCLDSQSSRRLTIS